MVKTTRYAAAGLEHYWVLDRIVGELHVYELRAGVYEQTQVITDEPTDVHLGIGTVNVDLPSLLA